MLVTFGFFSCYAAYDKKAKAVMRNLGKILLEKRGGRVVGFTGMIWTPRKIHSIIAWLAGSEDVVGLPVWRNESPHGASRSLR